MIPRPRPVNIPVADPIDAAKPLLLHVPPALASVSVTELPVQICDGPLIIAGKLFTVTVVVVIHPVGKV